MKQSERDAGQTSKKEREEEDDGGRKKKKNEQKKEEGRGETRNSTRDSATLNGNYELLPESS